MNMPFFVGIALALFSAYMLCHAIISFRKALRSRRWPTVSGHLVTVDLWGKRNVGGQMVPADNLRVRYEYEVQGRRYESDVVALYTLVYPETTDFAAQHPANSAVDVYFDPHDPQSSVLAPGLRKDKPYSDLIIGSCGVVAGVIISFSGWMSWIG